MKLLRLLLPAAALILPVSAQVSGRMYAQKLVDETLAKHREVVIIAMHVTPPGRSTNVIIASNIGRIGKVADDDDLRVINTGKPNLEVNVTGNHFEVELVLEDDTGKNIGALGVVFDYKKGDDKIAMQKKAEQVRAELRRQIPSKDKLFDTVPWP
jgi:iron complex outermembrane receptor protein